MNHFAAIKYSSSTYQAVAAHNKKTKKCFNQRPREFFSERTKFKKEQFLVKKFIRTNASFKVLKKLFTKNVLKTKIKSSRFGRDVLFIWPQYVFYI